MRSLSFRAIDVAPILDGVKTDTWRRPWPRPPAVGEQLAFRVGPRRAFAVVEVTGVETFRPEDAPDPDRVAATFALNGEIPLIMRVIFRLSPAEP